MSAQPGPMQFPPGVPPLQPGQQPTPEQIAAMQAQLRADAARAGLSVPEFIERLKQAQMEQQRAIAAGQQQPTKEQIEAMQAQLKIDAEKAGMSVPEFIEKIRAEQFRQQQEAQQQAQQGGQQQVQQNQPQPIQPGPPKPEAIAMAQFLMKQDLKPRTCILNGQRKEMFKVKRALRALQSPEYAKAQAKSKGLLPVIPEGDRAALENAFKLLPMSLLALRVAKSDPHEGHNHGPGEHKTKRVKGLWTVAIQQQQECQEDLHYVWLYQGSQIKTKLYAGGALALIFVVVLFPLWPMKLRLGVWYLSMGMLGLLGLFFAMAIFRLILFVATVFTIPPGLWLYPNLFEDVGFFDSFRPVWGWQEDKKKGKSKKVKAGKSSSGATTGSGQGPIQVPGQPAPATATTTAVPEMNVSQPSQRTAPRVEEVFDED